ncbi:MAG: SIR2 family protein [Thermodesulfovibrionales bacterium]|nr:SIR2 family protein [Thermodesulfovibrionales bacterium]
MPISAEADGLLDKISSQKVILFIGNGASADAGGPTTEQVVATIKAKFKEATYTSDDFIQTCTDVMETTLTSRSDLEAVIKKSLYDLNPSPFHLQLPLNIWPAIFTTNYDDLIEKAYREVTDRVQLHDPVFSDKDLLYLHDKEKVKIFKLMGCISSQHPDNKLILTREDYNSAIRTKSILFRVLQDIMQDGTILYIGYSFRDNLLLDIFSNLIQIIGLNKLPYSYALMPDIKPASIQDTKLRERKVIPLPITATEFVDMMKSGFPSGAKPLNNRDDVKVVVKGNVTLISHKDARLYRQSFDFLSEDILAEVQPDTDEVRRDFFRGLLKDWTGYIRDWDFKRNQYTDIFDRLKTELINPDVGKNKSIMVFGPAGSGKTILLRRLAYEAYRTLGNPVVILRPYYEEIDLKLLSTLCEVLAASGKSPQNRKGTPRTRVLVIMESAASHITDFKTIPVFMKSRGIPITLVASTRENDWEIACQETHYQSVEENSVNLSDVFQSEEERISFAIHLKSLGIIQHALSEKFISELIQREYYDSFFASVYSLVEPSRPTLDEKIDSEYLSLSPLARHAYQYVSSFYQYAIPLPIELLVRTLDCSYEQFQKEVYETTAKKIICEVPAPFESVYFGARHRIVAEKIVERQIQDMDILTNLFKDLLGNLNPINAGEVHLCRSLLVRFLGSNGIERRLSPQQTRDIFSAAIEQGGIQDPSVLHHFGLFESEKGNHDKALDLLEQALKYVQKQSILPFSRTERAENIYNTLGLIHSRKGQLSETAGDHQAAELSYSVATGYFTRAKGGVSQNPYPYDCECRMHLHRAERNEQPKSKLVYYLAALDVVEEAEDNLSEEEMPRFLELKARIQDGLDGIEDLSEILQAIQQDSGSPAQGALIEARLNLLSKTPSIENLKRAFKIIEDLVSRGTQDVPTLRTFTKLYRKIHPNDVEGIYRILKIRHQIPQEKRNLSLHYEIGNLAFTFEEYDKSREFFAQLERISQGHPKRWGIRDHGVDRNGKIVEFSGTVIRMDSNMGYVDIPGIRRQVPFLPYAQKYQPQVGENVTFQIGFNYRGWLAMDLIK